MKAAILIQAHKNPEQVARLCRALHHPDFDLFLNIDAKSDLAPFRSVAPDAAYIEERVDIRWGGFSQVRATLNGMKQILAAPKIYNFILLLSGQDYPIVPMSRIAEQLREHPNAQWMNWRKIEQHDPAHPFLCRHVMAKNDTWSRSINQLIRTCRFPRQHIPFPAVYKGSQWWTLSGACARYVINQAQERLDIIRFFERTHCSDEMFFQTLILNSEFSGTVISPNRRYTDWSANKPNPKILTTADYDQIVATDNWIARKFDTTIDSHILDLLDTHRETK